MQTYIYIRPLYFYIYFCFIIPYIYGIIVFSKTYDFIYRKVSAMSKKKLTYPELIAYTAEMIRKRRISLGLKQEDVENAIGISHAKYNKIETGKTDHLDLFDTKEILDYLNIPYDKYTNKYMKNIETKYRQLTTSEEMFIIAIGTVNGLPEEELNVIRFFLMLPKKKRETLLTIADLVKNMDNNDFDSIYMCQRNALNQSKKNNKIQ